MLQFISYVLFFFFVFSRSMTTGQSRPSMETGQSRPSMTTGQSRPPMECVFHRSPQLASVWRDVVEAIRQRTNSTRIINGDTVIARCQSPLDKCMALWLIDDLNKTNILLQVGTPSSGWIFVALLVLGVMVIIVVGVYLGRWQWRKLRNKSEKSAECGFLLDTPSMNNRQARLTYFIPEVKFEFGEITAEETLGRGHFATVHRGRIRRPSGDKFVSIKIYKSDHREHFINELQLYRIPAMEVGHENLLKVLAAGERPVDSLTDEFWLISELAICGNLQEFLRRRPIDWFQLRGISLSIVNGLCFLHTEIRNGEHTKPVIAHRDVSSTNILVHCESGRAVIADLGLATTISRDQVEAGEEVRLHEIGTLRYKAPEILEGALNLHDPVTALLQVDVYAAGLVLWETVWACETLWKVVGLPCPGYKQPFADEVGSPPTTEQMLNTVCKKGIRPTFPPSCYPDTTGHVDEHMVKLHRYVEDCWDREPEGRATIACTQERLKRFWDSVPALIIEDVLN